MSNVWLGTSPQPAGYMGASSVNSVVFVDANGVQKADPAKLGYNETTKIFSLGDAAGRIQADFSDATLANRVAFQTDVTNGNTQVGAVPNGTATSASWVSYAAADPDNALFARLTAQLDSARLSWGKSGTAAYGPLIINSPAGSGGAGEIARFGDGATGDVYLAGDPSTKALRVIATAGSSRWVEITGSVAGNAKIAISGGALDIGSAVVFTSQTVGTTVGAAGGASALPATPLGYLTTSINGVACKIPYYTP